MDDESQRDVLISALMKSGVLILGDLSSAGEFSSEALVSICARLLNLIDPTASFPDQLPDSLPERFTICTDISHSLQNLGYVGDISYYKFLHPSQDNSYQLVRFLVERLSEKNEAPENSLAADIASSPTVVNFRDISADTSVKEEDDETFDMHIQKVEAVLKDLTMTTEISHSPGTHAKTSGSTTVDLDSLKTDDPLTDEPSDLSSGYAEAKSFEDPSETSYETVELQNQHNLLLEELESGTSELCGLDSELELLKVAAERLLDDKLPGESYVEQLNQQLLVKRCNIMDIKKQWDEVRLTLETKKLCLLDQLHVEEPEAKEKFHKLRKTQLELQSLSSEIQKREDERCNLYTELERQPKSAPRKSYIHGIKEITKNSRKLDTDIQRISGETRELQLQSNTIQERLHRSYAVVDEMVTREVKKDPAVREVYKLVTSIHGIFEQISEKILMTDRLRREAVDYEKKLSSIKARGPSLEKSQADLDAVRKENETLEKFN